MRLRSLSEVLSLHPKDLSIPPCGLYFVTPSVFKLHQFVQTLKETMRLVNNWHYEKNCHVVELRMPQLQDEVLEEIASSLRPICVESGFSFIIYNAPKVAFSVGADGLLLPASDVRNIPQYRELLGEDAIIGVECGTNRKIAQIARDQDIDYVVFEGNTSIEMIELLHWWKTSTIIPVAIRGRVSHSDNLQYLAEAGADFIHCDLTQWESSQQLMSKVRTLMADIEMTEDIGLSLVN